MLTPFSSPPSPNADIRFQCTRLPCSATAATRAVCAVILSLPAQKDVLLLNVLATFFGNDFSQLAVCLDSRAASAPVMKMMLQAISDTESRDPRDASATATMLLNLCFSSCRGPSTSTFLAAHAVRSLQSAPNVLSRFCTDPMMALLWQHANNSPRECSDAMIASLDDAALGEVFGRNVTTCVLRSLLPAYVALCDARAIQCEEIVLALPTSEAEECRFLYDVNGICTPKCAALWSQLSTGNKCLESVWSVQEAVAYAANQTCGDSGELRQYSSVAR